MTTSSPSLGVWFDRLFFVVLVVATALAYAPAMTAPLTHYDDSLYLYLNTANLEIPGWGGLAHQWSSARAWSGDIVEFFPLRDTVYWLIYQRSQLAPTPYHLTSLFFHIVASAILFPMLLAAGFGRRRSQLAALVFALHPIHIESVAWAAGLKDPMFSTFAFSSIWAYLEYRKRPRPWLYLLCMLALVASLLVKSIPIVVPLIFVLSERLLGAPTSWALIAKRVLGPAAVAAMFLAQFLGVGAANNVVGRLHGGSLSSHVVLSAWAQVMYLRQALVPVAFRLIYCFEPPTSLLDVRLLVAVALAAVTVGLVLWAKRYPHFRWAVGWYFAFLLPVSNILPFPAIMADRYLYASVLASALGLAALIEAARPSLAAALTVVVVVSMTGVTAMRSSTWQDEESLWVESDLDPACSHDPSFPAAQSHYLRAIVAKDEETRLLANERFLASTDTYNAVSKEIYCSILFETTQGWAAAGHPERADPWARLEARECGGVWQTWYSVARVNLHRRLAIAAGAARKAENLWPQPRISIMAALTAYENGDKKAAQRVDELVEKHTEELCPAVLRWSKDVPALAPGIGRAVSICLAFEPDAGQPDAGQP